MATNPTGLPTQSGPRTLVSGGPPIALNNEIRGGIHRISGAAGDTLADIDNRYLQAGMLVYDEAADTHYQFRNLGTAPNDPPDPNDPFRNASGQLINNAATVTPGTDTSNWVVFQSGGGGGGAGGSHLPYYSATAVYNIGDIIAYILPAGVIDPGDASATPPRLPSPTVQLTSILQYIGTISGDDSTAQEPFISANTGLARNSRDWMLHDTVAPFAPGAQYAVNSLITIPITTGPRAGTTEIWRASENILRNSDTEALTPPTQANGGTTVNGNWAFLGNAITDDEIEAIRAFQDLNLQGATGVTSGTGLLDTWVSTGTYERGSMVVYQGDFYLSYADTAFTSATTPDNDTANWRRLTNTTSGADDRYVRYDEMLGSAAGTTAYTEGEQLTARSNIGVTDLFVTEAVNNAALITPASLRIGGMPGTFQFIDRGSNIVRGDQVGGTFTADVFTIFNNLAYQFTPVTPGTSVGVQYIVEILTSEEPTRNAGGQIVQGGISQVLPVGTYLACRVQQTGGQNWGDFRPLTEDPANPGQYTMVGDPIVAGFTILGPTDNDQVTFTVHQQIGANRLALVNREFPDPDNPGTTIEQDAFEVIDATNVVNFTHIPEIAGVPIEHTDTEYAFADGVGGTFTVTPEGGTAQTVNVGNADERLAIDRLPDLLNRTGRNNDSTWVGGNINYPDGTIVVYNNALYRAAPGTPRSTDAAVTPDIDPGWDELGSASGLTAQQADARFVRYDASQTVSASDIGQFRNNVNMTAADLTQELITGEIISPASVRVGNAGHVFELTDYPTGISAGTQVGGPFTATWGTINGNSAVFTTTPRPTNLVVGNDYIIDVTASSDQNEIPVSRWLVRAEQTGPGSSIATFYSDFRRVRIGQKSVDAATNFTGVQGISVTYTIFEVIDEPHLAIRLFTSGETPIIIGTDNIVEFSRTPQINGVDIPTEASVTTDITTALDNQRLQAHARVPTPTETGQFYAFNAGATGIQDEWDLVPRPTFSLGPIASVSQNPLRDLSYDTNTGLFHYRTDTTAGVPLGANSFTVAYAMQRRNDGTIAVPNRNDRVYELVRGTNADVISTIDLTSVTPTDEDLRTIRASTPPTDDSQNVIENTEYAGGFLLRTNSNARAGTTQFGTQVVGSDPFGLGLAEWLQGQEGLWTVEVTGADFTSIPVGTPLVMRVANSNVRVPADLSQPTITEGGVITPGDYLIYRATIGSADRNLIIDPRSIRRINSDGTVQNHLMDLQALEAHSPRFPLGSLSFFPVTFNSELQLSSTNNNTEFGFNDTGIRTNGELDISGYHFNAEASVIYRDAIAGDAAPNQWPNTAGSFRVTVPNADFSGIAQGGSFGITVSTASNQGFIPVGRYIAYRTDDPSTAAADSIAWDDSRVYILNPDNTLGRPLHIAGLTYNFPAAGDYAFHTAFVAQTLDIDTPMNNGSVSIDGTPIMSTISDAGVYYAPNTDVPPFLHRDNRELTGETVSAASVNVIAPGTTIPFVTGASTTNSPTVEFDSAANAASFNALQIALNTRSTTQIQVQLQWTGSVSGSHTWTQTILLGDFEPTPLYIRKSDLFLGTTTPATSNVPITIGGNATTYTIYTTRGSDFWFIDNLEVVASTTSITGFTVRAGAGYWQDNDPNANTPTSRNTANLIG